MTDRLHERVRRMRERALIRGWEYRQRDHARGVWHRLRRALVDAAEAWALDERDADRLESSGKVPLPVGSELEPPLRMFFVTPAELSALPSRRRVPLHLGPELLGARSLALVRHAEER
jgi:hypothetical protein